METNLDDLRSATFPRAVRGYARPVVDEAIEALIEVVDRLRTRVTELEGDRDALKERLADELGAADTRRTELEQHLRGAETERDELIAAVDEIRAEREARATYIQGLEQEITRFRELEQSLTGAVVAADRAGNEARVHAEREVTLMLEQARADARRIVFEASAERDRLVADVQRIRSMLASAQAALHEPTVDRPESHFGAHG